MSTDVHDLVLIHRSDKPIAYARVEGIEPDVKRGWWRVSLLILTVPVQVVTWILEQEQLDGVPFTMGGTPIRLDRIDSPVDSPSPGNEPPAVPTPSGHGGEVISLRERKKTR